MSSDQKKYNNKKIVIGLSGGISAYKMGDVIRHFVKNGAQVKTIMTEHAAEFITPMTVETLSGHKVITHIFPHRDGWNPSAEGTHHIDIAHWADVFLIAPATANIIGKIAGGIADDALSTIVMAAVCPVALAPAMNDKMYLNPIVQDNLNKLKKHGYIIIEPGTGFLACGYESIGRLADLEQIVWSIDKILFGSTALSGKKILITAGPTQEAVDPVRYLTNRSSGKMGYALARQAAMMDAQVTLISGPTALKEPAGVKTFQVRNAGEMAEEVFRQLPGHDILIMAAAVADFRPADVPEHKIKKESLKDGMSLQLTKAIDILSEVSKRKSHQKIIGFALETDQPAENARKKMTGKQLDAVVINNPKTPGAGFETDTNVISILTRKGVSDYPLMTKDEAAAVILNTITEL